MFLESSTLMRLCVQHKTVLLFLFSGGTAALFQLCLYVFLSRVVDFSYLIASSTAFVCTVILSFILQKFVTFAHHEVRAIPHQFLMFACLSFFNLHANGFIMWVGIERAHIHDIVVQMLAMVIIAVWSFFIYRFVIFKK